MAPLPLDGGEAYDSTPRATRIDASGNDVPPAQRRSNHSQGFDAFSVDDGSEANPASQLVIWRIVLIRWNLE
jgi:hypothetical protein